MTPEQLRMMNKDELLELLQSALNVAKHMSLVEDPRVHGAGENGPLMAIGDLEIWPRGESEVKLRESEAKCAVKDKALRIFIAAEEDWRKHGLPEGTDDLLTDAYQEALKALSLDFGKTIPQVRCVQCGITSPAQMEVSGPFAWQADAARKAFCSMRCFHSWMRQELDHREEARASESSGEDPSA